MPTFSWKRSYAKFLRSSHIGFLITFLAFSEIEDMLLSRKIANEVFGIWKELVIARGNRFWRLRFGIEMIE